jgi:3-oxoacyl-[acyl-carrier-protein] synthase-1
VKTKTARPVYISRIAHVSALGLSAAAAAKAQLAGEKNISRRELLGTRHPWFALPLDEQDWMARVRRVARLVAAELSAGAGISPAGFAALPLFIGSSSFAAGAAETVARRSGRPPAGRLDFDKELCAALGNATSPWKFSTSCTSGLAALEAAFLLMGQGRIETALALGLEFANDTTLAGFAGLGLLAPTENDDGLILGEALAGLLLTTATTSATTATTRPSPGWKISACRLGVDGYSVTAPTPDGRALAANLAAALDDAGIKARDIDLVKPHRVRVSSADAAEESALDQIFGKHRPPEISFKRQLGHTLGASGPAELTLLLALLDTAAGAARYRHPQRLLFNLIGFGGSIATLIVERAGAVAARNERQAFRPVAQNELGRGLHPLPGGYGRNPGLQAGVSTFALP